MERMRHGYTNHTRGNGTVVQKTYAGPDAAARLTREHDLLVELQGRIPVPPVLGRGAGTLDLGFVTGVPGQELLDRGPAERVLAACGRVLARIHRTEVDLLGPRPAGAVLVHGDFGPNNLLLHATDLTVTAVVDWEFAHLGDPVEDLAWCEWIVRMHHPDRRGALPAFFDAYGGSVDGTVGGTGSGIEPVPPWPVRQAAMLARCRELERFTERWQPGGPGVALWRERAATTAGWRE